MTEVQSMILTQPHYSDGSPVDRADALRAAWIEVEAASRLDATIESAWLVLGDGERVDLSAAIGPPPGPMN